MHQRLSFLVTGGSKASERASFHIAFALFFPLFGFVLHHIDLEIPNIFVLILLAFVFFLPDLIAS